MSNTPLPFRKYASHQDDTGNVWFNLWLGDARDFSSSVRVSGYSGSYANYSVHRIGRLGPVGGLGLSGLRVGDAGVSFDRRKDAENFALMASFAINGDLIRKALLDPRIYGGSYSRPHRFTKRLRKHFWIGCSDVDLSEGWADVDPGGLLDKLLPADEPFVRWEDEEAWENALQDYDNTDTLPWRALFVSDLATDLRKQFEKLLLSQHSDRHFLNCTRLFVARQQEKQHLDLSEQDIKYATLLALAQLKNRVPFSWVFDDQLDDVCSCLLGLMKDLPVEAASNVGS